MYCISNSITPVLAADLPIIEQFIFTSNLLQPTNRFLFTDWPNQSAQVALYLSGLEKSFKDPKAQRI